MKLTLKKENVKTTLIHYLHISIGWLLTFTTGVSNTRPQDTFLCSKEWVTTPKATHSKSGSLEGYINLVQGFWSRICMDTIAIWNIFLQKDVKNKVK